MGRRKRNSRSILLEKTNQELAPDGKLRRALSDKIVAHIEKRQTPETLHLTYLARPKTILPFLFSKTSVGGGYKDHIDNNFMDNSSGGKLRADLSMTIFLDPPNTYDGGELALNSDMAFCPMFKMPAGSALLYSTDVVHRVNPVIRGERRVAITWIESVIGDPNIREINADLMECLNVLGLARPNPVKPEQAELLYNKIEKVLCRIEKSALD